MSDLLKLLARNLAMGIVAGWITLAALIATNMGGIADVVFGSSNPVLPVILLVFGFTVTFGSLAMGAAVMMLPYEGDEGKDSGLKIHSLLASLESRLPRFEDEQTLVPIPVKDGLKNKRFHR